MIYFIYIFTGIVTGLLSGLFGIGGGIVIVPALIVIFKKLNIFPINSIMPIATATSLAAVIFTSASSAFAYNKQKLIVWEVFWRFLPGIILGLIFGKILTQFISSAALIKGFAIFLFLTAIHIYFKKDAIQEPSKNTLTPVKKIMLFFIAICIGILVMFFGVGGGIILVPTFLFLGLNIRNASATSAMFGVFVALSATIISMISNSGQKYTSFALIGYIYWPGAIIITIFSVFFAPIGVKIANNFQKVTLQKLFAVILTAVAFYLIIDY